MYIVWPLLLPNSCWTDTYINLCAHDVFSFTYNFIWRHIRTYTSHDSKKAFFPRNIVITKAPNSGTTESKRQAPCTWPYCLQEAWVCFLIYVYSLFSLKFLYIVIFPISTIHCSFSIWSSIAKLMSVECVIFWLIPIKHRYWCITLCNVFLKYLLAKSFKVNCHVCLNFIYFSFIQNSNHFRCFSSH